MTALLNESAPLTLCEVADEIRKISFYAKALELAVDSSSFSSEDIDAERAVSELALNVFDRLKELADRLGAQLSAERDATQEGER
jgi:hypothetical protein